MLFQNIFILILIKPSSLSSGMLNNFSWTIKEKFIKILLINVMNCCPNSSNLDIKVSSVVKLGILLLTPQQG